MPGDPKAATFGRIAFISAPIVLGVVLTLMLGGLWLASQRDRPALGERAEISLRSECPELWETRLWQRGNMVGLGELEISSEGDTTTLRAVLPGNDDDLEAMPRLLTAPGVFEVYVAPSVDAAPSGDPLLIGVDVEQAWFQIGLTGHAYVQVELTPTAVARVRDAAPAALLLVLDGEVISTWADGRFSGTSVKLQPERETTMEEVRLATDWGILLGSGPAPCAAEAVTARSLK